MGICQTCGGVNGQSAAKIVENINTDAPNPWAFVCPGHSEPQSKHDGTLEGKHATYFVAHDGDRINIRGEMETYLPGAGLMTMHDLILELEPQQALSFLSWLEQEKPSLEKMAGVEKDTSKG